MFLSELQLKLYQGFIASERVKEVSIFTKCAFHLKFRFIKKQTKCSFTFNMFLYYSIIKCLMTTRSPLAELNLLKKISDHPRLQSTLSRLLSNAEEHESRLVKFFCAIFHECFEFDFANSFLVQGHKLITDVNMNCTYHCKIS